MTVERSEVSVHEVRAYLALKGAAGWLTSLALAGAADIAPRTARAHVLKLVRLGLVDQAELFPGHRYRLSEMAGKRNAAYVQRLEQAAEVFGLSPAVAS
jgi:DNA-binding IclR family transcriptional regulator